MQFKLPDLGEGVAEGEIIEWKVAVGDVVTEDQPLVEVMTDKATVEIPSPGAGTIAEIRHEAGAVVPVGDVLVVIDDGAGGGEEKAAKKDDKPAPKKAEAKAEKTAAPAKKAEKAAAPAAEDDAAEDGDDDAEAEAAPKKAAGKAAAGGADDKPLATPAVRKLAREKGVELAGLEGSGPRGRITREDVEQAEGGGAAPAKKKADKAAAPVAGRPDAGEETVVPYRGLRRKIGEQMVRSAFSAPHFTLVEEVDMTAVAELRGRFKDEAQKRGIKLTFLPFVMKALCAALKRHPSLNAIFDEEAGELVQYRDVHVGFALDTDRGLVVPVIKDANRKNVYEIAGDLQTLGDQGRDGAIARENLSGSTITVTSAGSIGGLFATPVINWPEVAILGVYRIEDRPVVLSGEIAVRKMMYLSITLDHRVIDGGEAARFMNTMKQLLGDPRALLMEG